MSDEDERRSRRIGIFFAVLWAAIALWGLLILDYRTYSEEPFSGFIALTSGTTSFLCVAASCSSSPWRLRILIGAPGVWALLYTSIGFALLSRVGGLALVVVAAATSLVATPVLVWVSRTRTRRSLHET
jgi:hypothetical protein